MTFDEYMEGLSRLMKLKVKEEQILEKSINLDCIEEIADEQIKQHSDRLDKINASINKYNKESNASNFRVRLSMLMSELSKVYGGGYGAIASVALKPNKANINDFSNLTGVIQIALVDADDIVVANYSDIAINTEDWCIDGRRVKELLQVDTKYVGPVLTLKDKKDIQLLNVHIDLTKPYMTEYGFLGALQAAMKRQQSLNQIITDDDNKSIDEVGDWF